MINTQNVKDLSKLIDKKKIQSIDFLDVKVESRHKAIQVLDMDSQDVRDFLFNIRTASESCNNYADWLAMSNKITSSYFHGIPPELQQMIALQSDIDMDVLMTKGATNKTREMVRVLSNMLLKQRPRFEPDPSGGMESASEQDILIATQFLEYAWERGGLLDGVSSTVRKALRTNRGVMKTYWSYDQGDIVFKSVDPMKFWFDFSGMPEDSFWYCEETEVPYYKLELSGLFTKEQIDTIRAELSMPKKDNKGRDAKKGAEYYNKPVSVQDFYLKIRDKDEEDKIKWVVITFVNENILIRKTLLEEDDMPFSFFIPEREDNYINKPHSMNDVCDSSAIANYLNFKILSWIQNLADITVMVDEAVEVDRTSTPGVRQIRVNSTDGVTRMAPVVPTAPTINQDVFFHLERLERNAENNFGIHPNILQGVNGSSPSNGIVAETLLANDIQNTSLIVQQFNQFLMDVAYKILHIAYEMYREHRVIQIDTMRGNKSEQFKVIGGASTGGDNPQITTEELRDNDINVIKKFPSIKVTIKPGSAYTEKARLNTLVTLLNVVPDLVKHIPTSVILETFAEGSANLMMHQAAREAADKQMEDENPEIKMAEAENLAMSSGQARIVQANENHAIHDRVHLIEEMYITDQLRKANNPQEQQKFTQVLNIVRQHRAQHQQNVQAQQRIEEATTIPSPNLVGAEEDDDGVTDLFTQVADNNTASAPDGTDDIASAGGLA